jgi:hypothetical protein
VTDREGLSAERLYERSYNRRKLKLPAQRYDLTDMGLTRVPHSISRQRNCSTTRWLWHLASLVLLLGSTVPRVHAAPEPKLETLIEPAEDELQTTGTCGTSGMTLNELMDGARLGTPGRGEDLQLPNCETVTVECKELGGLPAGYEPFLCLILIDKQWCSKDLSFPLSLHPGTLKDFFLDRAKRAQNAEQCFKECIGAHEGDHGDYYKELYPSYPSRPELEERGWNVSLTCYKSCKNRHCGFFSDDPFCKTLKEEIETAKKARSQQTASSQSPAWNASARAFSMTRTTTSSSKPASTLPGSTASPPTVQLLSRVSRLEN